MEVLLIFGAIVLGLFFLGLAMVVFAGAVATAGSLLAWASEQGFVGVALYVILWVVAFPVMLVVCIIGGAFRTFGWWQEDREQRRSMRNGSTQGTQDIDAKACTLTAYVEQRAGKSSRSTKREPDHPRPGEPGYLDWANRTGPYARL